MPAHWLGLGALAVVLGPSLLLCASASAKMPQTITFTSTLPGGAVAGGSYEVSARSSAPVPVGLLAEGACSAEAPKAGEEQSLSKNGGLGELPPPEGVRSPITVHFVRAGTCSIRAETLHPPMTPEEQAVYNEYEPVQSGPGAPEQHFAVAKDPSERVTFTSTAPSNAIVGGSYDPHAISSEALLVSFFSLTPSVCQNIRPEVFANREIKLDAPGVCTIVASQADTESEAAEAPEAKQSFTVYTPGSTNATPAETMETQPSKVKETPPNKRKTSAKGAISAKVQARLLTLALAEAARTGEHHPREIQAVRTTEAQARTLENAGRGGNEPTSEPPPGNAPLYFIEMRGDFRVICHGGPGMHTCGPARVLMITVSVSAKRVLGRRFGYGYIPAEELPGTPVSLRPVKAHTAPSKHA